MKSSVWYKMIFIFIGLSIAGGAVIAYQITHKPASPIASCVTTMNGHQYLVEIKDGKYFPDVINAKRCDTLRVVNKDNVARSITFNLVDKHLNYAGLPIQKVASNDSFTILLSQTESAVFYDQQDRATSARLNVQNR